MEKELRAVYPHHINWVSWQHSPLIGVSLPGPHTSDKICSIGDEYLYISHHFHEQFISVTVSVRPNQYDVVYFNPVVCKALEVGSV